MQDEFCDYINDTVEIEYHRVSTPILGQGVVDGKYIIDFCSRSDDCNISTAKCPLYKSLNEGL